MTKSKEKEITKILVLALIACAIIGYFDGFAPIPYLYKACGKIALFLGTPLLYWKLSPDFSFKPLFVLKKEPLFLAGMLGFAVLFLITGTYFLLGAFLDLSAVTTELDKKMNINEDNFVAVAIYIALCNSFLEEFFFRGFLYFRLKSLATPLFAHLTSSIIFSLYHVAIMVTWFDWWVFALCMIALVIAGIIFNLLDDQSQSLYPSWLTHGCANLAINSIGMILFYT